ncbi:glycosyl transferase family protein [Candidatus Nitrosopumilus koreensis AR1]|uniref:Glycosyl transferase family protein n=1 Tax=Candidatus Nitrosopumilus koreensis AR1 TaxID=1229908 RepID=K0B4F2_9ARCH|nr:glycosyltransferase family A protein [Candidatus Nitrosopumilus koreensis]AFS80007.1 glycosyl transferase family protein [Candidatus Nitrosopumilus koreensis AR1]
MEKNNDSNKFSSGISIGLPVYNGEKFLEKRIKGILNQTFQDFEIIISNNASTDATEKICLEMQKQDSRITYHKQSTNIGGMSNFDYVLQNAKREFFVWAAVDDEWDSKFLEKNFEFLVKNKEFVGSVSKEDFIKSNEDEKKL